MDPFLNFSNNWNNKLDCRCFTTIRSANDMKYQLGARKIIQLRNRKGELEKNYGEAEIVYIRKLKANDITEPMARLDTGYSRKDTIGILHRMYKNKIADINNHTFVFIVLAKIK